ncbi:hypothetical protein ACFX4N_24400 [Priestia sp. YIM B13551]|uniref:hypothetical protein n=1 Tax=Priestia sp. YIM B13551 TaxID=3366306 RepID=UPI00366BB563
MQTAQYVRVKQIVLTRGTGKTEECGIPHTVDTWYDADNVLMKMAMTAPENGASEKVDYVVTFEDGETFESTYSLTKDDTVIACLRGHVRTVANIYAGNARPQWMKEEVYDKYVPEEQRDKFRDFLTKYLPL